MELTPVEELKKFMKEVRLRLAMTPEEVRSLPPLKDPSGYVGWLHGNVKKIQEFVYDSRVMSLSQFFHSLQIRTSNPRVFNDLRCFVISAVPYYSNARTVNMKYEEFECCEDDLLYDELLGPSILDLEEQELIGCSSCFRVVEQDKSLRPLLNSYWERQLFVDFMSVSVRCPRCRPVNRLCPQRIAYKFNQLGKYPYPLDKLRGFIDVYCIYKHEIEKVHRYNECCICHGLIPSDNCVNSIDRYQEHNRRMRSALTVCAACVQYRPFIGFDEDMRRCKFTRVKGYPYEKWYEEIRELSTVFCEFEDVEGKIRRSGVRHASLFVPNLSLRSYFLELIRDYSHVLKVQNCCLYFDNVCIFDFGSAWKSGFRRVALSTECHVGNILNSEDECQLLILKNIIQHIINLNKICVYPMNSYAGSPTILVIEKNSGCVTMTMDDYFYCVKGSKCAKYRALSKFKAPRSVRI